MLVPSDCSLVKLSSQKKAVAIPKRPGKIKASLQPEINMQTGARTYTAIIPAEEATDTCTQHFL